jgi:hypothetical protein
MSGPDSLVPRLARLIGPLGLVLVGVLLLVDDEATALLIADIGLGLVIVLALGSHLAFHRRIGRKRPTRAGR